MTVYDYIADSDPISVKNLCESYGYTVTNPRTMGKNLKELVNNEGEGALKSVFEIHPDKDIIVQYFSPKKKKGCGCKERNTERRMERLEAYLNASGNQNQQSEAKVLASNTNTIIFASALVLAVAIIFKNDK